MVILKLEEISIFITTFISQLAVRYKVVHKNHLENKTDDIKYLICHRNEIAFIGMFLVYLPMLFISLKKKIKQQI